LTGDPLHVLPGEVSVDYINQNLDGAIFPATNCIKKGRTGSGGAKLRFDDHHL